MYNNADKATEDMLKKAANEETRRGHYTCRHTPYSRATLQETGSKPLGGQRVHKTADQEQRHHTSPREAPASSHTSEEHDLR